MGQGDVVALRRGKSALVWRVERDMLWLIPIWGANGMARHRAEVRIQDLGEIVACGLSMKLPVARCHEMFILPAKRLASQIPIGRMPPLLLGKVVAAVAREARQQATEARLSFNQAA